MVTQDSICQLKEYTDFKLCMIVLIIHRPLSSLVVSVLHLATSCGVVTALWCRLLNLTAFPTVK